MAKIPSAAPGVRRSITLIIAAPLLCVFGIYGYLFYRKLHHVPPPERVISSQPFATIEVGGTTASLFTQGSQIRAAGNDLYLEFRDPRGQLTNVGDVTFELSLKMPGMVMHSIGKVFPTSTPGRYRTAVQPQMAADWSARLAFHAAGGDAETNFSLTVK